MSAEDVIFAGLDDVPWHAMNHAYGPAVAQVRSEMGPAASSAAPLLAEELADPRRLDNRRPGITSGAVDTDLDFVDLLHIGAAAVG